LPQGPSDDSVETNSFNGSSYEYEPEAERVRGPGRVNGRGRHGYGVSLLGRICIRGRCGGRVRGRGCGRAADSAPISGEIALGDSDSKMEEPEPEEEPISDSLRVGSEI
jgi:hypothetical protein